MKHWKCFDKTLFGTCKLFRRDRLAKCKNTNIILDILNECIPSRLLSTNSAVEQFNFKRYQIKSCIWQQLQWKEWYHCVGDSLGIKTWHYLNPCWLIIKMVLWHSRERYLTRRAQNVNLHYCHITPGDNDLKRCNQITNNIIRSFTLVITLFSMVGDGSGWQDPCTATWPNLSNVIFWGRQFYQHHDRIAYYFVLSQWNGISIGNCSS